MSERPQNRHLRPNPETLGVQPLGEGETTVVTRARVPAHVARWWQALSAEARGRVIVEAHAATSDNSG